MALKHRAIAHTDRQTDRLTDSNSSAGHHGSLREPAHVSFVCQRCYHPLRLENSLFTSTPDVRQDIVASDSASLSAAGGSYHPAASSDNNSPAQLDVHKLSLTDEPVSATQHGHQTAGGASPTTRHHHMRHQSNDSGSGFTLLGEASASKTDNFSNRLRTTTQLFDRMSGETELDHPLCEECTDNLLGQMDEQLALAETELAKYEQLFGAFQDQNISDEDDQRLTAEIESLQQQEQELLSELANVDAQRTDVAGKMKQLTAENEELAVEEQQHWRKYNEFQRECIAFKDEQASVENQLRYAQAQLDKLRKINVFNSTFHIWHQGHFGTINNFRIGRLPTVPVEWSEINAAWGQTVLLLHSLAKKIALNFQRYRLVPYGNHSYVECTEDKQKELPLYGSGGFRFFWDTKFDQAMVAFLDCLQQFKEEVEKGDSGFYLPYRMDKGKIYDSSGSGAFSVKIQFNSEEHWTKALKFMLTNLKWGLAWVSSQFADKS